MKKLKMWMLKQRIEQNWKQIGRNRREMAALLEQHEAYSSEKLVKLDEENARLGVAAAEMEHTYGMLQSA